MEESGLSWSQIKKYFNMLMKKSKPLLNKKGKMYVTTEKGLKFLEHYHDLQETLKNK